VSPSYKLGAVRQTNISARVHWQKAFYRCLSLLIHFRLPRKSQLLAWIDEDTHSFDYGGFVVRKAPRDTFLLGKGSRRAVFAGTSFVDEILHVCAHELPIYNRPPAANVVIPDHSVELHAAEGHEFKSIRHIVTGRGKAGICSCMGVLHLIYSPGATELLPCVSEWFFAVINDSSNV